jgi:hypothetical protein
MSDIDRVLEVLDDPRYQVDTVLGENIVILGEAEVGIVRRELSKIRDGGYLDCGDEPLCCHVRGHGGTELDDEVVERLEFSAESRLEVRAISPPLTPSELRRMEDET